MSPYGNTPDSDWPFTSPLNTKPSAKALVDAVGYSLIKYFTIPEDTTKDPTKNTKILTMKQVLSANSPIGFGSDVRNSIMNVGTDGLEPYSTDDAKDPIAGGHARVIIGYDDTIVIPGAPIKGAFRVRNSWDTDWGDKGYSWVSYQIFIDQQTDCMGVTSENYPSNNPTPTPSPTPTPTPTPVPPQPDNPIYDVVMELDSALPLMKKSTSKYVKQAVTIVQDCITKLSKLE
jgi:hypothetical protein